MTELDLAHTNSYGAKMHAWLISEAETDLKAFSKRRPMPEMREELENARNKNYHISLLLDLRFGIICMSMKIKRIFSEITWQPEPYGMGKSIVLAERMVR